MMPAPGPAPTAAQLPCVCPGEFCWGRAFVGAGAGGGENDPERKTTTAEPARPMLMGASVSCGLIARAESEDQGRADGGLGSGAKAVAGGAKAEAPRVGRGLLVSTVHAGTAGAVRPSPVRGAKAGGLYPGLRRRSFRHRTIGSRLTESIRSPGAEHCGHELDNLHRRTAARLGVHRAASRRPARCASRGRLFFFQAEDGIRDLTVTGVQTCALPI